MAGHYILKSISHTDLILAQNKGATWSDLQHEDIGWTENSQKILTRALNGEDIGNRDSLPPHRYLQFAAARRDQLSPYLKVAGWADDLVRPNSNGLGLRQLTREAAQSFANGYKNQSLVQQLQSGNVSIEIYYITGEKMA